MCSSLGTDVLKERMLQSCLSNSNLRERSLNKIPRPFHSHLETTARTGGPKKHAFLHLDRKKPVCSPVQWLSKLPFPPSLFQNQGILRPRSKTGVAHLLRPQGAKGLSIVALIAPLPGGPTVSLTRRWPGSQPAQAGRDCSLHLTDASLFAEEGRMVSREGTQPGRSNSFRDLQETTLNCLTQP